MNLTDMELMTLPKVEGEIILKGELCSLYVQNGIEGAVDDVSGTTLDPDMVRAGRDVEMGFFKTMGVFDRVPRSEQRESGGNRIGTKWIRVNKRDFDNLKAGSRLVGKEFVRDPTMPGLRARHLLGFSVSS